MASLMPARRAAAMASPTPARGGSWMPMSPTSSSSVSAASASASAATADPARRATASTRRPFSASAVMATFAVSSVRPAQRGSTASGAPLTISVRRRQHRLAPPIGIECELSDDRLDLDGSRPRACEPASQHIDRGLHRITDRDPRSVIERDPTKAGGEGDHRPTRWPRRPPPRSRRPRPMARSRRPSRAPDRSGSTQR